LSPLFLCLQDTEGEFGTHVATNLKHRPNIKVTCSKSGNLQNHFYKTGVVMYFFRKFLQKLYYSLIHGLHTKMTPFLVQFFLKLKHWHDF
jgi:hypothetical protein